MSIFIRLALAYLLVISVSITSVLKIFYDEIKPGIRQASEETLVDNANLLAELLLPYVEQGIFPVDKIDSLFERFLQRSINVKIWSYVKQSTNLNVYITDAKGLVIFHSSDKTQLGKDYSRWLDVSRTLVGKYGARTTRDDPEDDLTGSMYVAAPILKDDKIIGVVTLIQAHQGIQQFVGPAQTKILVMGSLLLLTLVILGIVLATGFNKILKVLTQYVNRVRDGQAVDQLTFRDPSFNELASTLHKMRQELDGKAYIEQYVHSLTHELKTPLSAISAAAQILETDIQGEKKQQFINNIESEVQRSKQLIERLLLLASIENNQHNEFKAINLLSLIEGEIKSLQPLLANKNMNVDFIKLECSPNALSTDSLIGDEFLLRMAIRNMLDNAIDFAKEGSAIKVQLVSSSTEWTVKVFNQGEAIPDYALNRIFERFFSTPRPGTGRKSSGLGLCLIKEIAMLHHGHIHLSNINHDSNIEGVEATLVLAKQ